MTHFELEILAETLFAPLCENQRGADAFAGDDAEMTDDVRFVNCPDCLDALGFTVEQQNKGRRAA